MIISYTIVFLSMFFWIFSAVKQYRTELFWYFLALAASDPISLIFYYAKILGLYKGYNIFAFLTLLSLYGFFHKKTFVRIILLASFILLILSLLSSVSTQHITIVLLHIMIFLFFVVKSTKFIADSGKLNIFHIFLILYETTIILKMLAQSTYSNNGVTFFYATSAFEILIAIFFSMFKENDSRLLVGLKGI